MNSTLLELLSAAASTATAVAVFLAAKQLRLSQAQAVTTFEDSLAKEYRELASKLPTKALLGEPLSNDEHSKSFDEMYHYFDLCNEQIFSSKLAESPTKLGYSGRMELPQI